MFSPDGRWLAYTSNETLRSEIFVQPFPGPGGKWQVSTDGGQEPAWSPDGKELFYRDGKAMMAVPVETTATFSHSKPRLLFEDRYEMSPGFFSYYSVAPDGQRFLMIKPEQGTGAKQFHLVTDWLEELKRRAGGAKK